MNAELLRRAARTIRQDKVEPLTVSGQRIERTLLAVADWLDAEAEVVGARRHHALAVARAYLGEDE